MAHPVRRAGAGNWPRDLRHGGCHGITLDRTRAGAGPDRDLRAARHDLAIAAEALLDLDGDWAVERTRRPLAH